MSIVTTNLRIKREDLLQIKVFAAEAGMSFNEYVNKVLQRTALARELGINSRSITDSPVWNLAKLAAKRKSKRTGLSKEDQVVYE